MVEIPSQQVDVPAVARSHERLCELAAQTDEHEVQAILNLAAAVLLHGHLEPAHLAPILRFVDPVVLRQLAGDHAQLEKEVAYVLELRLTNPEAADVAPLAESILERVRQHLVRDDRTLYGPLARLTER